MLDVEIERRDEDLARVQGHGVGEEIAVLLVLKLRLRDRDGCPVDTIDADPLLTLLVDPADLVVDPRRIREG
nr:hypothetical protein [Thiocapsa sp. KS1]